MAYTNEQRDTITKLTQLMVELVNSDDAPSALAALHNKFGYVFTYEDFVRVSDVALNFADRITLIVKYAFIDDNGGIDPNGKLFITVDKFGNVEGDFAF